MERARLTKKQKHILDYVESFLKKHGYAPSYREIAKHFKLSSVATVAQHIKALEAKGLILKNENEARSILPAEHGGDANLFKLPVLGLVQAGNVIEAIPRTDAEELEVPEMLVKRGKNSYVLEVKGDSMIDDGIMPGDFIIIQERQLPLNGEMVIARIDENSVTLKRYFREKNHIRLQPANEKYEPIIVKAGTSVEIDGVVVGVIRKY